MAIKTEVLSGDPFAMLIKKAESAKNSQDFTTALALLSIAKKIAIEDVTHRDQLPFIICREALCTYKTKEPTEEQSYLRAKEILEVLEPTESKDVEVLGLSGAINKRLNELTDDISYLENAIKFYEKGFLINPNIYNGINVAFMYYKKASLLKKDGRDWEDIKLKANYYCNTVLELSIDLENKPDFKDAPDAIWILFTIAEVYHYKKAFTKMEEYENKAKIWADTTHESFAIRSYEEQKEKIKLIFEILNN